MADIIKSRLAAFRPAKNEKYDPGRIVIFFDSRTSTTADDQFSTIQAYYTAGLYKLGWPSIYRPELDPGMIRLVWYTHAGNEGHRDYPLHRAYVVKEMFDSLADGGFRPMVLGWSGENPFPMIGGSEPPPEPQKPKIKVATTWSGRVSGHGTGKEVTTPHDRVMAIIEKEEQREADSRKQHVLELSGEKKGAIGVDVQSPV